MVVVGEQFYACGGDGANEGDLMGEKELER